MPGINRIGMNTATSDTLIETTVKPTSALPRKAASRRPRPEFEMAHDILEHDHGVVDDEARADGESHQRKIVDAVAEQIHRPERADDRQRQRHGRYPDRARRLQEDEDHGDHQHHGDRAACARYRLPRH